MSRLRPMHICVPEELYLFLRWASDNTGLSMAKLVRQAIVGQYEPQLAAFVDGELARSEAAVSEKDTSTPPRRRGSSRVSPPATGALRRAARFVRAVLLRAARV